MRGKLGKLFAVLLALIVIVCGILVYITLVKPAGSQPGNNPGDKPAAGLSVSYAGKEVQNGENLVIDGLVSVHEFAVNTATFTVNITPNEDASFTFSKNGEEFSFLRIADFNGCFNLKLDGKKIIIDLGDGFSMQKLLEKLYPTIEIILPEDFDDSRNYFNVEITADKEDFIFSFGINNSGVTGVILNETSINFS